MVDFFPGSLQALNIQADFYETIKKFDKAEVSTKYHWLLVSLVILLDYRRLPDASYLYELWLLFSFLWLEFPFAGLYSCLRWGRYEQVPGLVLMALTPPALLHFVVFFVIG